MHNAFGFPLSHDVQNVLVHQSIPFILLIGFEDAKMVIGLARIDGGHSTVDSVIVRVFWSTQLLQDVVLYVIAGCRDEPSEPAGMVGRSVRWLIRQVLVHRGGNPVTSKLIFGSEFVLFTSRNVATAAAATGINHI